MRHLWLACSRNCFQCARRFLCIPAPCSAPNYKHQLRHNIIILLLCIHGSLHRIFYCFSRSVSINRSISRPVNHGFKVIEAISAVHIAYHLVTLAVPTSNPGSRDFWRIFRGCPVSPLSFPQHSPFSDSSLSFHITHLPHFIPD